VKWFNPLGLAVVFIPFLAMAEADTLADADSLLSSIWELRGEGQYGEALEVARELAESVYQREGSPPWEMGDAERRVSTLERIGGFSPAAREELARADRLQSDIEDLQAKKKHAATVEAARQQRDIREQHLGRNDPEVATSLNALGVSLRETGGYVEAETALRRALDIRKNSLESAHPRIAESLNDLGTVLYKRGNLAEAEPLIREALALRTALLGPRHEKVGKSLNNLAIVYYTRGDLIRAGPLYRKALAIHRESLGNEHPETAALLNNLAILLSRQGNYGNAKDLFIEVLEIRRRLLGPEHPTIARSMGALGTVLSELGDFEASEALFRDALALRRERLGEEHVEIAANLLNLSGVLQEKGDCEGAEAMCRDGLEMGKRILGPNHPLVLGAVRLHAGILMDLEREAEAESRYREALDLCRERYGPQHPHVAGTLHNLGECLLIRGRVEEAESLLAESATVFEAARLRAGGGFTRATFQESPYCHLSLAQLGTGQEMEAWQAAEKSLGRALADLLIASGQQSEAQTFSLERVQSSLTAKTALIGWLWVELAGCSPDAWGYVIRDTGPVRWVHLEEQDAGNDPSREEAAANLRESLSLAGAWPFRVMEAGRITADATKIWAEWFAPLEEHLSGAEDLVVIPSGPLLGIPFEALVDARGRYLGDRYLFSYAPSATIHAWLYGEGMAGRVDAGRKALLVGDPPFTPTHLAAMESEEASSDSPARVALAPIEPYPETSVLRDALVGDETALAGLPRLPWTREEVKRVSVAVPRSTILLGEDASEQQLVGLAASGGLEGFDTIHLATHALMDDERPERSALVLSRVNLPDAVDATVAGTRVFDGLLSASEIVAEFPLDADLVTLSGCQTALGREAGGEGYIGLASAFFRAGARSLVVSLWRVEDEATALLMGRFYENLTGAYGDVRNGHAGEAMCKSKALREAKHWLRTYTDETGRQPFRHPAYWSGFVLIGNPQ
jgi:CHAT domain-containing protein/tetratricopeptide (TPR) repeat protein